MVVERFLKHAAGIAILMGGLTCSARQAAIPFGQIQPNAQLSAKLTAPTSDPSKVFSSGPASATSSSAAPSIITAPAPASEGSLVRAPAALAPRTPDARYFLLNSLHLGMAGLDIAMTHRCIADHQCREGNPLMPSSLGGQIGVDFALVGYGSFTSYWLKKHLSRFWWTAPAIGIAAHGVGAATGFAHQ